jgi:uncharacterized protein (DUF983 family)
VTGQRNFIEHLSLCFRSLCPVCGKGNLFVPYLKVKQFRDLFLPPAFCAHCQFQFRREPGYYFGVLTPSLSVLSILAGMICGGFAYFILHLEIPDVVLASLYGLLAGVFVFFRMSIAFFIALDHSIDPPHSY